MTAGTDLSAPPVTERPVQSPFDPLRSFAPPPELPPRSALGGWWRRVGAALTDALLSLLLLAPVLGLAALAAPLSSGLSLGITVTGYVLVFAFLVWQLVRQGRTGATYGKELLGLRLLTERHGRPIGVGAALARPFVHLIDGVFYLGYLWPLWDAKRQTFTDKAMNTVVLKVPARKPPVLVASLALALTGLLLAGSLTALAENGPDLDRPSGSTATVGERLGETPAPPPPVGPLPVEDTAGRIAPAPPGYVLVGEDVTGLGSLDVQEAAALGGGSEEDIALSADVLRGYGLEGGFGQGFGRKDNDFAVVAYRFSSAEGAARFLADLQSEIEPVQPSAVPGALVYDPGSGSSDLKALTGAFASGSYVYELTLLDGVGDIDGTELERQLVRQYEHVQLTG